MIRLRALMELGAPSFSFRGRVDGTAVGVVLAGWAAQKRMIRGLSMGAIK